MTTVDLYHIFRENLMPPDRIPMWQWAERNIYLSPRQATSFPGWYSSERTPYVRGIFDALQDSKVRKVTVEKGAQTGLTLSGYIWLCWTIANDPAPVLLVYPNEKAARSASETRMMPMIEDCPTLKAEMPDSHDEWTKLQQRMKRCTINWVGSNSPANLASRPVRYLFLDETDKYPVDNQTEASPMALAEQRTKTFWNRKIFKISTPTTPDGAIHSDYMAGDQSRFFVPCPNCKGMQFLKWSQVKWPKGEPHRAGYECEFCGKEWTNIQKNVAVSRGEWRATATPKDPEHRSFHVSSLYSPWTKLGSLARRFIEVKDFPNELQDFINSELGEPFERATVHLRDGIISEREGEYQQGERFVDTSLYYRSYQDMDNAVFIGVDVQQDHLVAVARLFTKNGSSGQIDRQLLSGFQALNEYANQMNAHSVLIDCGYRTQEVYEASLSFRFIPTKGSSFRIPGIWEQTQRNIYEGTRRAREGVSVGIMLFDPNQMKDQLYDRIMGDSPFVWLVPKGTGMDQSYCSQMVSEARDDSGKWKPVRAGRANHFWDAEVLCLLGATVYGYNTYIMEDKDGQGISGDSDTRPQA